MAVSGGVKDVDLAVARLGDGVVGWKVGAEATAVRSVGNGEGDEVILLVSAAGGLGDGVVNGEADGLRVSGLAGAGG